MANRKSQKDRLITAFKSGNDYTTNQIASRLDVSNSRARYLITELRQSGFAIYKNRKTFTNGDRAIVYKLGTPSRRMVAIAARYAGSQIFG